MTRIKRSTRLFVLLLLSLTLNGLSVYSCSQQNRDTLSSLNLADPTIFHYEGTYYLYGTSSNKGFLVYQSKDMKRWTGPVGKRDGFALAQGDAFGDKGFWAPQVFRYRDKFYMAYTANEQIAIAESDSPLGPFRQKIPKAISGTGKQIDPFVFFNTNGKAYLYHVKLQEGNRIFVSEMDPALNDVIPGTAKPCISATDPWENTEKTGWPVTEGPTVFKRGKYYFMIYSANDFRSNDYAVGYATSLSPAGPWTKHQGNPIISRNNVGKNGTGHGDLFQDSRGKFHYVMHTHFSDTKVERRRTALIDIQITDKADGPSVLIPVVSSFNFLNSY